MTENDKQQVENTSVFEGFDTDNEGDDDIHFCKRCKLMFTSLEEYLKHKVKHDNYKVTYSRSGDRRTIVPKLVQKPDKTVRDDGDNKNHTEEKENRKQKQRGRKKLTEEVNTELLVVNKQTYWCPKCNLRFNREATLRRHVEYVHDNSGDYTHVGDEDYDEDGGADSKKHFGEIGTPHQISSSEDTSNQAAAQQHTEAEDKADRPYVCNVCSNRFKEINVLNAHMLTHTNKRDFRCNFPNCNYSFKTKGSLKRHVRRHTGERPFSCEECGRRFTESGALTRHLKSRVPCKNKSDNDLPRYGKRWGFSGGIDNNMRMTATCPKSEIPSQSDLVNECEDTSQHYQQEQDGETECAVAEVIASSAVSNIEEAVAIAVKENLIETEEILSPTQCKVCKEDFLSQDVLRIHLRTHLADVPFKCGLCHFIAETRNQISSHMISQHQSQLKGSELTIQIPLARENESAMKKEENQEARIAVKQLLELPGVPEEEITEPAIHKSRAIFKCPVCLKAFRNNHYLRQHMRAHTGERPHKCPHCDKSFITKDTLSKHLSVHSDMRNYKCGQCGKLFKRISHVREHLKIHSSERPFPCTLCEKSFKTNNAMKVHLRTHTRILPYVCPFCRRRFREKGSLQRHQRIHTGERPYRCKHCGRSFAEHGTLNRHLKAKMPCTQQLQEERQEEEQQQLKDSEEMTVLAEFSSVVADTQQYMMSQEEEQDTDQIQENMEATEYVVVQTGLNLEDLKNVEIITEEEVDSTFLEGVQVTDDYVVVTETGENMKIVDSRTGETLATMPLSSITDENQIVTLESTNNQIEAVAMAPTSDGETELVNVLSTSSDIHIASDSVTQSSNAHTVDSSSNTEVVAIAPLTDNQIEAIAMAPTTGDHMEVDITNPVENTITDTVVIATGVDIGDSLKQAMVAADVVEEQVETTSNELF